MGSDDGTGTRYFRQLITKDGIKGPLEEMKEREVAGDGDVTLFLPRETVLYEKQEEIHYRNYRYRRQVRSVVFEYEEE
jgi:hypothetical protein